MLRTHVTLIRACRFRREIIQRENLISHCATVDPE